MNDKNIKAFEKLVEVIHKINNEELTNTFLQYYDIEKRENEELLDYLDKRKIENEKTYLKAERNEHKINDLEIETHHLVNNAKNDFLEQIKPFFDELPNVTKAVLNKPRVAGLLLLLFGNKWVYDITHVNLDEIIKNTHDRPNNREVKE